MNRHLRVALATAVLTAAAAALAQVGRIALESAGPVTFTVTEADLAEARTCPGCIVVPQDPGTDVAFVVTRQSAQANYVIDLALDGWSPTPGPTLEVRWTIATAGQSAAPLTTAWQAVDQVPTEAFDQAEAGNRPRARVTAEYRLRLTGNEAAGAYTTAVTYRVRGTSQAASHSVRAGLPTFLALRWVGASGAGTASLRFDYGNAPNAYLAAVASGAPLPPTSADFERLEVSTNHPSGYTVAVWVQAIGAPTATTDLTARLRLRGEAIDGQRFASTGPTDGFVTLATPADFGLVVDATEHPGAYRFEVRYEATRNP